MSRNALLIGSNANEDFGGLKYARSDAGRVGKALKDHGGFEVSICSNSSYPALRDDIHRFITDTGSCDALVVYFAGHGEIREGELFLVVDNSRAS
jgi:Caspase domain